MCPEGWEGQRLHSDQHNPLPGLLFSPNFLLTAIFIKSVLSDGKSFSPKSNRLCREAGHPLHDVSAPWAEGMVQEEEKATEHQPGLLPILLPPNPSLVVVAPGKDLGHLCPVTGVLQGKPQLPWAPAVLYMAISPGPFPS